MLDVTYYVKWTNWGRQVFTVGFYALGLEIILLTVNWGYRCQRLNFSVVSLFFFFFLFFPLISLSFPGTLSSIHSETCPSLFYSQHLLLFRNTADVITSVGDGKFSIILWLGVSLSVTCGPTVIFTGSFSGTGKLERNAVGVSIPPCGRLELI